MSWTHGVQKAVLPNGLTLLAQRHESAPVVAVVTHVRAGYFDEPDEWVGISHVLEHMYFKGTARRGPGDIARETQLLGGYINAGTIYDKTVYYTVLPSATGGLERALDVQADALMHAALDAGELERELEVIIQEAKRKLDTPSAMVAEGLYELLFRVHRMRRWRIGTEEGLRRLIPSDVRQYYATRYAPGRVIVALVGDLDPAAALQAAAEKYGVWPAPTPPVGGSPAEPNGPAPALRVRHGDVERPLASVGWRTVGSLHQHTPALDLAAIVLGAGRGSRMYRDLRVPGLAARASASHYTPTEVGVFTLALEGEPDRIDVAVGRAVELVAGLVADGPSHAELERAKALTATLWARRFETMDGRASILCEAEALGGYHLADELYGRSLAVSPDNVSGVVREYLDPAAASAVLYLPDDTKTRFDGAWPPPVEPRVIALPGAGGAVASPRGYGTGGEMREYPGEIGYRFTPGADLLVRRKRGSGLVTLLLQVAGIPGNETPATAGISWLLARASLRGAGGLTGEELAQAAERLGGGLSPGVGSEAMGWGITVRADAMREAADLLRRVALEAELAATEVAVERDLQVSDARRVRDDMFHHPLQQVLARAFPGDPYGLPALGEPDVLVTIDADRVRSWAESLGRRRAVVVAVGDLERDRLLENLDPLAAWPGRGEAGGKPAPLGWEAGRGAESRRKEQTAVAMAFPAVPFGSPDRYPLAVIRALLSGLAGRLFEELRERRSLAYQVAALPWLARRGGVVLSYIATSPEREDEAREAMLAELARLAVDPITTEELERARNYAAGTVEVQRQSGGAVAAEILDAWVLGVVAELAELPERLRGVTLEDVVRVAESVFRSDRRAEYVVRGGAGRAVATGP